MAQIHKTTIKDVAKEAGVSFTLVSKFLTKNPQARMTDATRKKIEVAIKKLGYRPSASARALRSGKTKTIGIVIGDLTNSYFAHIANIALKELAAKGYQLIIALNDNDVDNNRVLQSLELRGVDGIIYLGSKKIDVKNISCPIAVNDMSLDGALEINPVFNIAITDAIKNMHGKILGMFFENSLWDSEFKKSTKSLSNASSIILPFPVEERKLAISEALKSNPDFIFISGWKTILYIQKIIETEFKGYSPKFVLHANCQGDFLSNKNILGVIYSSTTELISKTCDAIIQKIEIADTPLKKLSIDSHFIKAGSKEFSSLEKCEFKLT